MHLVALTRSIRSIAGCFVDYLGKVSGTAQLNLLESCLVAFKKSLNAFHLRLKRMNGYDPLRPIQEEHTFSSSKLSAKQ